MIQSRYLALDLGATKFASMLSLDGAPSPLRTMIIPSLDNAKEEFAHIAQFLAEEYYAIRGEPILCAAPCLDEEGHVISWPNRPYWCGFPLLDQLQLCLGCPVGYLGDGEAAALADADKVEGVIYISLYFGTGIASGIVANTKALRFGPVNSELGHIVVDPQGPNCVCGKIGCVQAVWRSYIQGNTERDKLIKNLAQLTVTLSQIFPACVITFGGRLLEIPDNVTVKIRSAIDEIAPPTAWSPTVKSSMYGGSAPIVGAMNEAVRRESTNGH